MNRDVKRRKVKGLIFVAALKSNDMQFNEQLSALFVVRRHGCVFVWPHYAITTKRRRAYENESCFIKRNVLINSE